MNWATILVAIPVAALIIFALVKTIKNRGKCSGCSGNCACCRSSKQQDCSHQNEDGLSGTDSTE